MDGVGTLHCAAVQPGIVVAVRDLKRHACAQVAAVVGQVLVEDVVQRGVDAHVGFVGRVEGFPGSTSRRSDACIRAGRAFESPVPTVR